MIGIVIVKDLPANNQPGVIVDDHNEVSAPVLAVFADMGKVTGISLPEGSEEFLLKRFTVFDSQVPGGLQVIAFDETLDGSHGNGGRKEAILNEPLMDLGGIESGELLL